MEWRTKDGAQLGKWTRQNKAVPTFQPPAARVLHVDRHNRGASLLRDKDRSLAGLVNGTTRTVRRNQYVRSRGQRIDQLKQCRHTPARTRPANCAVARALDENGNKITVATGADQANTLPAGKAGIEYTRQ